MTAPLRIAVVVGSLRAESCNRRLMLALAALAPPHVTLQHVEIGDLPLYNQDFDARMPPPVLRMKSEIAAAGALIIATPEYNRSIPGVLKNALDWGSRPYGGSVFNGKPGAVIGMSPGANGTAMAQQHLRSVLAYLNVPTLCQPEAYLQYKDGLFDTAGRVTDERMAALLAKWLTAALGWFDTVGARSADTPA